MAHRGPLGLTHSRLAETAVQLKPNRDPPPWDASWHVLAILEGQTIEIEIMNHVVDFSHRSAARVEVLCTLPTSPFLERHILP